jgi:dTDP-L-rhamnose 4-epimerase
VELTVATVLVTGGAGFIGSHTADALIKQGHRVRVLDLLDPQVHAGTNDFPAYLDPSVERLQGDVRNPEDVSRSLDGVEVVYHFAALTGVGQSMYELRKYVDTNCTGTATVLEAIVRRRRPLKKFILASSRAVYGEGTYQCPVCGPVFPPVRQREDMEQGRFAISCPTCRKEVRAIPTREDRLLRPISVYGWTKQQQEELCRQVAQTFNIPIICLRYFNVYGSRQSLKNPYTGVLSVFFSRLTAGQPISLYEHGQAGRDFVHVSDVVQANILAAGANVEPGTCLNVGSGREVTIAEVATLLARACGRIPEFQDRGEFRVGDIRSCFADLERTRRLLGYMPRVSLEEGVSEFVKWARGQESADLYEQTVTELQRHGLFGGNPSQTAKS